MYNKKGNNFLLHCVSTAGTCRFRYVFVHPFSNAQLSPEVSGHAWVEKEGFAETRKMRRPIS